MNFINKIKPTYLLILLVIIAIPLVLLLFPFFKLTGPSTITPTPTMSLVSPTAVPTLPPGVPELRIIRAAPIQNPQVAYLPVQSIELTFTKSVLPEELKYKVEPYVETTVRQGSISNALIIRPVLKWEDGETIITILPSTTTSNGARMSLPFIYRMISSIPPAPEGEGNY